MTLRDELHARLAARVRITVGSRAGFTYALVKSRNEGAAATWFVTPPEGMDRSISLAVSRAGSYWGADKTKTLSRHLDGDPAPRHSMIAGLNDDAWIATEDPEVILYMGGLD